MTDAFLVLGSHFLAGHVDPESIDPEWRARRRDADMVPILEEVMEGASAGDALRGLLPEGEGYRLLRAELRNYRALDAAGGWARIPGDGVLQRGDDGPRVEALRSRLTATGDLTATPDPAGGGEVFDDGLDAAVRRFQARHGLDADGKAGPRTLAALNRSAAERADQIAVNMERWRWLPQDLGSSYVLVNIADFHLDYVEGGVPILAMRAIVGRSARRTPVFSDQIRYMVVNPSWEVPPKLAVEDILPEVRKDSSYLTKMGIQVFEGWGTTEREVDPASIDWSTVTARNFRYRFRQRPGPTNALGKLKFMFPNKFNIYLHDTPKRDLFQRTVRDFSSGCVRVEQPLDLAARLLRDDASWDQESISSQIESGREKTIPLPEPIPVHLLYWTAWVDEDGTLQFREDLYGRDRRVLDSLRASRPDPEGAP